ncbi:G-protein coupled receptor GRL101-like [Macrobrachium rosenbergii]|uniref:G-protein coupled receptor GRL101-like n=1 Tax=Macrobrachium rosenbergii TaxID=79674 RepID=UPI0034D65FBF
MCSEDSWQCSSGQCVQLTDRCDLAFDCADKSDEQYCDENECGEGLRRCHTGQCVPESFWCDHINDCPDKSDELHCGVREWSGCADGEFPCASGAQCIPAQERCILSDDRHHGCADHSHLLDCKSVTCPAGMFQCRSGPCLDEAKQCDGNVDCPETWDDEDFCPFECSHEVPECLCHHLDANCSGLGLRYFPDIEININRFYFADNQLSVTLHAQPIRGHQQVVYLDLSRNQLQYLRNGTFSGLWRLRILILSENNLRELTEGAFAGLHSLRNLQLDGNQIAYIGPVAFYGLSSLPTLDLSSQQLREIAPRAFVGLRNLTTLYLSDNYLVSLDEAVFTGLKNLQKLDLTNNELAILSGRTFNGLPRLAHLATDEWRWCCLVKQVETCLPEADQFSSCEDLMSNIVLRVCIWILGLIALFGNSFVIFWRSIYSSGNKMHSFLIVNLGLGDLMMGVYLLIVAVVDLQYRGVYAAYEEAWRSSSLCQVAGFISTFSSELSVFTLTVITVDRLMVIKFPFGVRRLGGGVTKQVMGGVWVLVTLLAALPLTYLDYFKNFYGRSGVCLALHITNEKPNGWEYAVFIFLVLNLLSFSVIAVSYALMYAVARETRTAVGSGPEARPSESGMATRMTLIVATDAACWLPIIFLGIASLCGAAVPPKVFSWIAVFVLPLNAAVNPVLYTLSTAPVRKRLKSLRQRFCAMWGHQSRSAPARSGNHWPSMKTRMTTEMSDIPPLNESDVRTPKAKPSMCIYTPVLSRTAVPCANTDDDIDLDINGVFRSEKNLAHQGPMLNGREPAQRVLCLQNSITCEGHMEHIGTANLELVRLEEVAKPLPASRKNSRKHNRRKNVSDDRYD